MNRLAERVSPEPPYAEILRGFSGGQSVRTEVGGSEANSEDSEGFEGGELDRSGQSEQY